MTSLYLASGSPRRQELLTQLGVAFERIVTGIEEKRAEGESAQQYVSRLAREKALAGVAQVPRDLPVLGADTIVILNGSYHAVVGLPLVETYELLSNFNSLREGRDNYDG